MNKSNCCNARLYTVTSNEGTAYYMCTKCKNPSDTGKGSGEMRENMISSLTNTRNEGDYAFQLTKQGLEQQRFNLAQRENNE